MPLLFNAASPIVLRLRHNENAPGGMERPALLLPHCWTD